MKRYMCNFNNCSMSYRYIRRRKRYILLIFTTLVVLYIWTDGLETEHNYVQYAAAGNCKFPCIGLSCLYCRTPGPTTVKLVDIADHLNLKQALRRNKADHNQNVSSTEQVCKRPSFDLRHDSLKYGFFQMDPLNCSAEELFYLKDNVFRFNKTQLGDRQLENCKYYGIERESDDYATFTDSFIKEREPFDMVLLHDFVRIKCFLKAKKSVENKDIDFESDNVKENKSIAVENEIMDKEYEDIRKNIPAISNGSNIINVDNNRYIKNDNSDVNQMNIDVQKVYRGRSVKADKDYDSTDVPDNADSKDNDNGWNNNWIDDWDGDFDASFLAFEERPDFDQLFVQVQPKSEVFQRIDSKTNSLVKQVKLNVLMFGLDSMSHLSYQRKLPKTYKYLKKVLGAVIMDGYNIVGDATTAALIPMLTGKTEMELPEARRNKLDSEVVDVYPLVWNKYRDKGYVTMFAEDEPTISVFNLRLNGFRDPPTDHYMRPFWQGLWETGMRGDSPRFCTGNVPHHMHLINYMKDFFVKYDNVSKFAFMFGSELTHWDNNPGEYMDDDFVELLKFLKSNGHLDNTVLFVFGDHGARYTKVRKTVQGKMEERLPLMSITFPKWFRKKYPIMYKNLVENSDRLTTPFDVHETLLDILDLRSVLSQPLRDEKRGISWLRRVPLDRTCSDADIQIHWCTCLKQLDLDRRDKHVHKSVTVLLNYINRETKKMRNFCAELKFARLHSAFLLVPNEKVLMFQESSDEDNRVANFTSNIHIDHVHFQITIETSPNQGLYEGTVQANMTSGVYTVLGTEISRLDMYGSQPECIQENYPDLRKYCYCKKHDSNKKTSVNIPRIT